MHSTHFHFEAFRTMNPQQPRAARSSSDAELAALDKVCERLCGFDASYSFERVDGLLCAIAAGPRPVGPDQWLVPLLGETFERAFGDPQSQQEALQTLLARLAVLHDQLDPEALFAQPEYLRLEPLMAEWTEAQKQAAVAADVVPETGQPLLQDGVEWAAGFLQAVEAMPELWAVPPDEEAGPAFAQAFRQIEALLLPPGGDDYAAHLAEFYPDRAVKGEPTRDDLLAEACLSVQDLRMHWVDFLPRTEPRRVAATPGRNDPCPCGSGKKYKKCHGV